MTELDKEIVEANCRSMGEYFHRINKNTTTVIVRPKNRSRHTRRVSREHEDGSASFSYEQEFDLIWSKQESYHPEILCSSTTPVPKGFRRTLHSSAACEADSWLASFGIRGIIFFQRKMYWPKSIWDSVSWSRPEKGVLEQIGMLRCLGSIRS